MTTRETDFAGLDEFVAESNRIEGVEGYGFRELAAYREFLSLDSLLVADVARLVAAIGGKPIRSQPGMNVRVGSHIAPPGGPEIAKGLAELLYRVNENTIHPWLAHVAYVTLHPFLDGNGRSGRAVWAWQVLRFRRYPGTLAMGFLHPAYYAALEFAPTRQSEARRDQ